ncbi:MAG: glycosyltransferase family protein [Ramlibacter sp.]|nr:glycosyltransferase family protein [Ramlibacter sp.]
MLSAQGRELRRAGQPAQALVLVEQAMALRPDSADIANQHGITLRQLSRAAEAVASFDRAIALAPTLASAHANRANALRDLGQREAAIDGYDRALSLNPGDALAWQNRGVVLAELGLHALALASLEKALSLDDSLVESHWNLALVLLRLGDFERGWREFEWRWHKPDIALSARHFSKSRWTAGEPLAGRTMLVCAEQGLGDTLQFCRYLPWLSAQGARTKLLVQPELVTLLSGQLGITEVATTGSRMPRFDASCSLMSLSFFAGTRLDNIPLAGGYLQPPPERLATWRERVETLRKPRIGLVWSGRPDHGNDANRSLSLEQLLLALPSGPHYVSLQNVVRASDAKALRSRHDIAEYAPLLTDMAETAALCECMDLVISVDTSVAHLAGALGKPVWLLLPFNPDWRWLLERDTSPWYEQMTLLRQSAPGDWRGVLGKLAARLQSSFPCSNSPAST